MAESIARALTIAGSDSGGGAGIQADLKTFAALGCYGTSAITALTAQNTRGVTGIHTVSPAFVEQQIDAVLDDIGTDAAKTGMLANRAIVQAVARAVERHRIERLVVDPVLLSKHGAALLRDDAVDAVIHDLLPRALIVTPNSEEAARIAGREVRDRDGQRDAARVIGDLGPRFVLVKGGHLDEPDSAIDLLYDGTGFDELAAPRIDSPHTHGTGCTLSAAITAFLALGHDPRDAAAHAKEFVTRAIESAVAVGDGIGPVNPMWSRGRTAPDETSDGRDR
jgi:hydroxymethylpyrimidine/phosphomethylpyrimidine kinase